MHVYISLSLFLSLFTYNVVVSCYWWERNKETQGRLLCLLWDLGVGLSEFRVGLAHSPV